MGPKSVCVREVVRGFIVETQVVYARVFFLHLINCENKLLNAIPAPQLQLALGFEVGQTVPEMRARFSKLFAGYLVVKRAPFYVLDQFS